MVNKTIDSKCCCRTWVPEPRLGREANFDRTTPAQPHAQPTCTTLAQPPSQFECFGGPTLDTKSLQKWRQPILASAVPSLTRASPLAVIMGGPPLLLIVRLLLFLPSGSPFFSFRSFSCRIHEVLQASHSLRFYSSFLVSSSASSSSTHLSCQSEGGERK